MMHERPAFYREIIGKFYCVSAYYFSRFSIFSILFLFFVLRICFFFLLKYKLKYFLQDYSFFFANHLLIISTIFDHFTVFFLYFCVCLFFRSFLCVCVWLWERERERIAFSFCKTAINQIKKIKGNNPIIVLSKSME